MRTVYVEVKSATDVAVDAEIRLEIRPSPQGSWKSQDSFAVTSGTPEAKRQFLLGDNERIVIEARGGVEMVMDREQNAVMPRAALESQPTQAQKEEMEAARQKELKERGQATVAATQAAERAGDRERDRVMSEEELRLAREPNTPHPVVQTPAKPPSVSTGTSQGAPQSPAAVQQSPKPGSVQNAPAQPVVALNKPGQTARPSSDQMSSTKDK